MNTHSAMAMAAQRHAEDQARARQHALARRAASPARVGHQFAGCSVSAGRRSQAPYGHPREP